MTLSSFEPFSSKPFDLTYRDVTARLEKAAAKLPEDEQAWLIRLIEEFKRERLSWGRHNEYFTQCKKLRLRALYLVAGAYLHISYDLPRVIADNWPGHDPSKPIPSEARGEEIFF